MFKTSGETKNAESLTRKEIHESHNLSEFVIHPFHHNAGAIGTELTQEGNDLG